MKRNEHIEYWINSADHDLESAEELYRSGKYDWSLFIGHLVLEKALKAFYVGNAENKIPPRIHNLARLAEISKLELSEDQKLFLDEVNDFNLAVRYPEYKNEFYKTCTKDFTEKYFRNIKEFYLWIKSRIK